MSHPSPLRVLLVDDYAIVREGLAAMLAGQPDIVLVGMAADDSEALALVHATCPDVVLLDLVIPGVDSLALLQALRQAQPAVCILVLISVADTGCIRAALRAGAAGYLPKDTSRKHLLTTLRTLTEWRVGTTRTALE